jgi:hypothetical protein
MKPYSTRSDSKDMSEPSIFNKMPVPILKNSSIGMASCRFSPGKSAENILTKKRSLFMRTSLNLRIMTLVVCAVLALFACGLHGKAEMQESNTTDGGLRLNLQVTADADDPFSGTWVLNLSKSKIPSQLSASSLKSNIAHVVMDASDIEITQEAIFESDAHLKIHVKAKFDGKDYPITGAPGAYSVAYQRFDKNTIKAVIKSEGKIIVQETGAISPDGRTFAIIVYIMDETGKQATVIPVFEKK